MQQANAIGFHIVGLISTVPRGMRLLNRLHQMCFKLRVLIASVFLVRNTCWSPTKLVPMDMWPSIAYLANWIL